MHLARLLFQKCEFGECLFLVKRGLVIFQEPEFYEILGDLEMLKGNFLGLLENYNKWGTTTYWIGDDTFNDSIEKLEMFLKVTKRLPFKLNFRAYIRLDIIAMQPDQIQMLYDMGLKSCWIGIETFHPEASKTIGKGMSAEKRKKALYDIQKV